jgi:hypothetical protein
MRTETLLVAVGLALVAGGTIVWSKYSDAVDGVAKSQEAVVMIAPPSDSDDTTGSLSPPTSIPTPAPAAPVTPSDGADGSAGGSGEIQVTTRLSSIHGSPSASAPVLYAFPAGRQLRVVSREAGFARIEDVQSGATGWVDERLLAPSSTAAVKPAAPGTPSVSTEPEPAEETQETTTAAQPPPAPTAPVRRTVTTTEIPPPAPPTKQTAKRNQRGLFGDTKRANRDPEFPSFLRRAFGGR